MKAKRIDPNLFAVVYFIIFVLFLTFCFTINLSGFRQKIIGKVYLFNGNMAYQHQAYDDAEVSYRRAILTDPSLTQARYNLGNAYYKQQRYQDAIRVYKFLLTTGHYPINADVWNNLGNAYYMSRNPGLSISALKNALLISNGDDIIRKNYLFVSNEILKVRDSEPEKKDDKKKKSDDNNAQTDKRKGADTKKDSPHNDKSSVNDQMSDKDISDLMKRIIQNEDAVRDRITNKKLKGDTQVSDGKDY